MAFIEKTAFEARITNNDRENLSHIAGVYQAAEAKSVKNTGAGKEETGAKVQHFLLPGLMILIFNFTVFLFQLTVFLCFITLLLNFKALFL